MKRRVISNWLRGMFLLAVCLFLVGLISSFMITSHSLAKNTGKTGITKSKNEKNNFFPVTRPKVKGASQVNAAPGNVRAPSKTGNVNFNVPEQVSYQRDKVLIKFKPGTDEATKSKILSKYNLSVLKSFQYTSGKLLRLPAGASVETAVSSLKSESAIELAEPDYALTISANIPNDPSFQGLWGMDNTGQDGGIADADIDAPEAWDLATGDGNVVVAVIDTGVDYLHEDLQANMWINTAEANGTAGVDDDLNGYIDDIYGINTSAGTSDPFDDHGHGTHVSGTIGAVGNNATGVTGVNWNVQIMALKFLDSGGGGWTSDAVECINYVINMHDNYGVNVKVTSNSWGGGGYTTSLYNAINALRTSGILFVAAAGNSAYDNDISPHYPSSYDLDNIISVAATDNTDNIASFSNYGKSSVDVAAPGVNTLSTLPGYNDYIPSATDIYFDDVESGAEGWTATTPWAITTAKYSSGLNSWTDSPGGDYSNNTDASLTTSGLIDLSIYTASDPIKLGFFAWIDIESYFDNLYIEASGDGGATWTLLGSEDGRYGYWGIYSYAIPANLYTNQFQFRIRLSTDSSITYDGVYIDDIGIGLSTLPPPSVFFDDVESGAGNWTATTPWTITTAKSNGGLSSWTDSPDGDYSNYTDAALTTSGLLDLSGTVSETLTVSFSGWIDLESYYDNLYIEASGDGGTTWVQLGYLTGHNLSWKKYFFNIPSALYTSQFQFRLRLSADYIITYDGVYIDDIGIGITPNSNKYGNYSGTSMATPHVSGLAALILSYHSGLTLDYATVRAIIRAGGDPLPALAGKILSGSRINAYQSLLIDPLNLPPMLDDILPSQAPKGADVTITGNGFGNVTGLVTFQPGVTGNVVSWSDTRIIATIPNTATSGLVAITRDDSVTSTGIYMTIGDFLGLHAYMSQGMGRPAVAGTNDKIYVLGGYTGGGSGASGLVQIYYPYLNYWGTGSSNKPTVTANAACAVIGGKIYVAGGYNSGDGYLNVLEIYDPATDTWTTKAPMPEYLSGPAAVTINGYLYVIGGNLSGNASSILLKYDPASNTWSQLQSMTTARAYFAAGVIAGKIYAFGGIGGPNGSTFLASAEVYDLVYDTWTPIASMNTPRYDFAGVSFNGKLYAMGGNQFDYWYAPYLGDIEVYDPVTAMWSVDTKILNSSRQAMRATVLNNQRVFVIGGYTYSNTNESFSLSSTPYTPLLISNLSANPSFGVAPLDTTFGVTATGGSGSYTYSWDFGDGSPVDTTQNPSHNYTGVGTYQVIVTVTDADGSDNSTTGQLTVTTIDGFDNISIGLSATPLQGEIPILTTFIIKIIADSPGPYKVVCDFGDGDILEITTNDTTIIVTHTYTFAGNFQALIAVTSALGAGAKGALIQSSITISTNENTGSNNDGGDGGRNGAACFIAAASYKEDIKPTMFDKLIGAIRGLLH